MNIEILVQEARNSISRFCYEECNAYCCKKGYLILSEEEIELMIIRDKEGLIKEKSLYKMPDDKYAFNLNNKFGFCPRLVDNKCTIHKHPNRSLTCKKFPIFVFAKSIKLSNRCLAVREGKLYAYIHKFKKMGYQVLY
jgi:Fe-S-cluster containining protein